MGQQISYNAPSLALINTNGIRATYPVVGADHAAAATAADWLLGRSHVLVADGPKVIPEEGSGPASIFRYYSYRDPWHYSFYLQITMSALTTDGSNTPVYGSLLILPFGTPQKFAVDTTPTTYLIRMDAGIASAIETEFAFQIFNNHISGDGVPAVQLLVHQIMVFEAPNPTIDGTGVEQGSFQQRSPIFYDSAGNGKSIDALSVSASVAAHNTFRRGALFTCAKPLLNAIASPGGGGTTSYANVFIQNPAMQAPLLTPGQTVKICKARIYGYTFGTCTSGDVRISMTNGSSTVLSYASHTPGWSSVGSISVKTDDPSRWPTDGGIRSGARDVATIQYRATGTAGAGSFAVTSVCIWDEPE